MYTCTCTHAYTYIKIYKHIYTYTGRGASLTVSRPTNAAGMPLGKALIYVLICMYYICMYYILIYVLFKLSTYVCLCACYYVSFICIVKTEACIYSKSMRNWLRDLKTDQDKMNSINTTRYEKNKIKYKKLSIHSENYKNKYSQYHYILKHVYLTSCNTISQDEHWYIYSIVKTYKYLQQIQVLKT